MEIPSSSTRDVARRLLASQAAKSPSQPHEHEAVRVCEKLRISLTRFAGAEGFTSLVRRGQGMIVVALTGWGYDEDRRRSQEAGFDFHIVKPVALEALEELLAGSH